jgi:hypothetical protein
LFEDHVQPLICKFRKWGSDASPSVWMLRRDSNTSVNPLTALLNSCPTNISSAVFPAYTPESTRMNKNEN